MTETPITRERYAIIGLGNRAKMYVDALAGPHAGSAELVAWADSNSVRMDYYERELAAAGHPLPARYPADTLEEMIRAERVDRLIVTTPDYTHAELVSRALRAGVDVVVEKPLTIDAAGVQQIAAAIETSGKNVLTTFNYRYSPRNSALKRVITSGQIGVVTSVHFEWALDTVHGADYFRRWHRNKENSGGLLIHKASHHFDLVNWWIAAAPTRVFASGGLRFYGQEAAAERGLTDRPDRGTGHGHTDPFALDLGLDARLKGLYLDAEHEDGYLRDRDVFDAGITIEDNLAVLVDYDTGVTMSYSLNAHSPWEGYRVVVNGTEGRAELDVVERGATLVGEDGSVVLDPSAQPDGNTNDEVRPSGDRLIVQRHWQSAVEVPIENGSGGHGGGDDQMLADIFARNTEDDLDRPADFAGGVRAVSVGIAGNRSLATEAPVRIRDLHLGVPVSRATAGV
jgi:predicted dehydrogenase